MSDIYNDMDKSRLYAPIDNSLERMSDVDIDRRAKNGVMDTNSVCLLFGSSLRRYESLLQALETRDLLSTHLVPKVKDEIGRLRIWGEETCAVLPQNARRSLDQQLREDEDTKQIAIRSLRRLDNHIERAIKHTEESSSITGVNTESEENSSSSDESDTAQEGLETGWEMRLRKIVNSISEEIRSLYRISVLLRCPRNPSKSLRSSNSTISSYAALKVTAGYTHISEKIRQWRDYAMRSKLGTDQRYVMTENEDQLQKKNAYREMTDIVFFCERLTWANLFRRKQFDHWVDCPDVPESQERALDTVAAPDQVKDQSSSDIHTSLSTDAKSTLGKNYHIEDLLTIYANSAVGRSDATDAPEVPRRSKTDPNFECPFCHIVLDSEMMQKRETWKEHVFQDLQPYVCSFEQCLDPGRLFITQQDWIYHEQQMHRRKWICLYGCAKDLLSKTAMVQHLVVEHSNIVNERQVSTYADMCERQIDDTEAETCLICLEEMPLSTLHGHLATHMEEIAFFVLPMTPDDDEDTHIKETIESRSHEGEKHERIAYDNFLRKQRGQELAEEQAYREALRKQRGKEEAKERDYQAFLHQQKEKREAEDKAMREKQAHIDSVMRERLEQLGLSQRNIEIALDPEKAGKKKKDFKVSVSSRQYTPDLNGGQIIPVYPRINRKFLDIETLERYDVPWEWDRSNSDYIILLRELNHHETEVLFDDTRRRRRRREGDGSTRLHVHESDHILGDAANEARSADVTQVVSSSSKPHEDDDDYVSLVDSSRGDEDDVGLATEFRGDNGRKVPRKYPADARCIYCSKQFTRREWLARHLRLTHNITKPP